MNLHLKLHRNNKGIGTIFGMVFFLLIVMIVFASLMIILNQNTGLQQTVMQTNQLDQNKASEQLTISQQPNSNLYTNIGSTSVTVNFNITNSGTLPVQVIRLWIEDLNNSATGYLPILPTDKIYSLTPGESQLYSGSVQITLANSNDTLIFWVETTRGNQFTLQQLNGVSPFSVYQSLSNVFGDFLPYYHSIQWSIVTKQGSNYVAGPWHDGWIINPNSGSYVAFRINLTYWGQNTLRIDNDTNIWLENFPGSVYDVGYQEDELPLLYISNYTASTQIFSIYTGHEMTVTPSPIGTNITLYFATLQTADDNGLPINPQTPSGYELEDIEPTVIMTATIYGMSPSTYAQSFLLYAAQSRTLGIDATPPYGPVGTTESVDGTSFQARTTISLFYDSTPITIPTTTTNTAGNFGPVTFIIPPSVAGTHTITAVDSSPSHNTAIAPFTVIPTITLSQTQGPKNTPVTVTGTGFAANSNVGITFGGNAVATTPVVVTTDGFGSFTATFLVPASVAGATPVAATDASGNTASSNFGVTIASISLAPPNAKVGATVTVSGSNFISNSPITIALDGVQVATTTAIATGAIPGGVTFTVPATPAGAHTITATDSTNNIATATLTVTPNTIIAPTSGPYGTSVSITGQGFAASSPITLSFNGANIATSPLSLQTDNTGSFSGSFIVPSSSAGAQPVLSSDGTNSYSNTFTVITRAITLNPTSGPNGATITVTGSNFEPIQVISLSFDASSLTTFPTTVISSGTGAFSCTFNVPNTSVGSHTVNAGDTVPNAVSATFGDVASSLTLNPNNGPIGTRVTVTGSNFLPNSPLTVTYNGVTVVTPNPTSSSTGTIPNGVSFPVPASTFGPHSVVVTDGFGNSATATYTVNAASLALNPVSGLIGTSITATGQGFAASSLVTITFPGYSITTTPTPVQTDTSGSFACSFNNPSFVSGAYIIQASDGTHTAPATFTVNPDVAITLSVTGFPSPVTAGTAASVTVTARDTYGNIATGYRGTVHFTSSDGQAVLPANYVFVSGDNGVHTFTNGVTLKTVGTQSVTATDTVTGSITGSQIGIIVTPGALDHFTFSAISTPQTAGTAITGVTITAVDANGNTVTSYVSSTTLTETAGGVGGSVTQSPVTFAGGIWSGSLTVTKSGSGVTITATGGSPSKTGTSNSFTVNPGALAKFAFATISTQTTGTAYSITVTAQDANGNTVTSYVGNPGLISSSWVGTKNLGAFTSGTRTGSVTSTVAGSTTITATDGVTGTSNSFTVLGTFGNTNTGTNYQDVSNLIRGSPYVAPATGTLQSITAYIYVTSTSRNIQAALYTTSGALLGTSNVVTGISGGAQSVTFSFNTKPSLTAGTTYELVLSANSGGSDVYLYYSGTGASGVGYHTGTVTFNTWPSVTFTADTYQYCIYGTYSIP